MTNRKLASVIKDQDPLVLTADETVEHACQRMWERRVGAVLVTDENGRLVGIFTPVATPFAPSRKAGTLRKPGSAAS